MSSSPRAHQFDGSPRNRGHHMTIRGSHDHQPDTLLAVVLIDKRAGSCATR
jgi:hypothetical protein